MVRAMKAKQICLRELRPHKNIDAAYSNATRSASSMRTFVR